jgi:hypothetical protein
MTYWTWFRWTVKLSVALLLAAHHSLVRLSLSPCLPPSSRSPIVDNRLSHVYD